MQCKNCGKEVTHYQFTKKEFCNIKCQLIYEKKEEVPDVPDFFSEMFNQFKK